MFEGNIATKTGESLAESENQAVKNWDWKKELVQRRKKEKAFLEVDFSQPEKIIKSLEKEYDFIDQILILEKAITERKTTVKNLKKIFNDTRDNTVRLSIIEAGAKISNKKEQVEWIEFMVEFGKNYNENIFDSRPIKNYWEKNNVFVPEEEVEDFYSTAENVSDGRYRAGDDNSEILISAAIFSLANFGEKGERGIIEILDTNIQEIYQSLDNIPSETKNAFGYINENNELVFIDRDEREDVLNAEHKEIADPYYFYNFQCFQKLIEMGSRQSIDYAISFLEKYERLAPIYHQEISDIFKSIDREYAANKILEAIGKADDSGQLENLSINQGALVAGEYGHRDYPITKHLVLYLSDLISSEEARLKLEKLINISENKNENPELYWAAYSLITPCQDKIAITNLQKFYQEKIEFQNYKLNEKMNAKETALLKSLLKKDEKILEAGCGAGRLILELLKDGYDVSGFDFTAKHVEHIKKQNPEAPVFQGDWHYLALPNESKDAVYSLGRNILHDYSIADQAQAFRDVARVLKPGGKFIFDIPNREKGTYKKMVEKYAQEMKERGVRNFRYGAIYDSPDGKNFATRYAYSQKDIEELAQISGFRIVEIRKEELETGQGDENLYFVLEKTEGKK